MITTDDQRQQNGAEMKKNADGCKKWEEERAHFAFSRKKECCWYEVGWDGEGGQMAWKGSLSKLVGEKGLSPWFPRELDKPF